MDKYGLIGYPLGHSFSKQFFTEKFAREGIDAVYENYEIVDAKDLLEVVRKEPNLRGLNCTIPHKQAILPLLDDLSDAAREIGAVNVIQIRKGETEKPILKGFNSDYIGFTESIKPLLSQKHHKALVFGTGGASHAVCYALTKLGIEWQCVSRRRHDDVLCYEGLTPDVIHDHKVIVNCSPVGMFPRTDDAPKFPYEALTKDHLLYDLIYNPLQTRFLQLGAEYGATTKNGLEMLHLQAEASWKIWNKL